MGRLVGIGSLHRIVATEQFLISTGFPACSDAGDTLIENCVAINAEREPYRACAAARGR
jgi:hypothetical protein